MIPSPLSFIFHHWQLHDYIHRHHKMKIEMLSQYSRHRKTPFSILICIWRVVLWWRVPLIAFIVFMSSCQWIFMYTTASRKLLTSIIMIFLIFIFSLHIQIEVFWDRDVKEEKFKFLLILSVDVNFSYSVWFLLETLPCKGWENYSENFTTLSKFFVSYSTTLQKLTWFFKINKITIPWESISWRLDFSMGSRKMFQSSIMKV